MKKGWCELRNKMDDVENYIEELLQKWTFAKDLIIKYEIEAEVVEGPKNEEALFILKFFFFRILKVKQSQINKIS